jgi:hypothetical protein
MADNQFDILIRFGLSKEKATEAIGELKKIEAQTKITGTEGVKQEAAVTEATKKTFTSKKELKDMVKQLGHEFPILGQIGRLAMNPIVAATTAVTASLVIMKGKFDEAVKAGGGFQQVDVSEDVVSRFERISTASQNISTNLSSISNALDAFEKNKTILDSFAKGFGNADKDDLAKRAQATSDTAHASLAEADRLKKIAGNFNPNNAAAGDMAKLLPELKKHRDDVFETLTLIQEVRDGSAGMMGSAKYMSLFGLASPDRKYAQYQTELSGTDAQIKSIIASGKNRGMRAGAFEKSNEAEVKGIAQLEKAASLGSEAAAREGASLKSTSEELAKGNFLKIAELVVESSKQAQRGNEIMEAALRDQAEANARIEARLRVLKNQQ